MLKFVFILVVGAFVVGAALGLLAMTLQLLGYALVYVFKFLAWVYRQLEQAYMWAKARRQARLTPADKPTAPIPLPSKGTQEDVPTPQAESPVNPVVEAIAPADADGIEAAQAEPAPPVRHVETPIEPAQPEPKAEEKPTEPSAGKPVETELPNEPESKVATTSKETANLKEAAFDLPPDVSEPAPEPPIVSLKPMPPIAKANPPQVAAPRVPITPPRPPAALPPARSMFPQLPDFVGIGRRRFRLMVEKDPDGRPGVVIVCQLLGAFKEGWRGPIRLTVTAQEFSDGKHHPLIRLGNSDFDPANPDVIHDYPDGGRFGFREWTTVARINLNDFEGYGSGSSQLEVTCRGWELRDGGDKGDLLFEDTEILRAFLVTGGYYARKQRRVEQLKAVVVVLRLFVCLDGGERNITNRLNRHFEALGARFLRRWVGRDIALRDLINAEFSRRLQGSRFPADMAATAKLADASKDLRDWLLQECTDISEEFKPQTPDGEAVKQLAALSQLLGGPDEPV